jgi:hypothetical protein
VGWVPGREWHFGAAFLQCSLTFGHGRSESCHEKPKEERELIMAIGSRRRTVTKAFEGWRPDAPAEKIMFQPGSLIWAEARTTGALARFTLDALGDHFTAGRALVAECTEAYNPLAE